MNTFERENPEEGSRADTDIESKRPASENQESVRQIEKIAESEISRSNQSTEEFINSEKKRLGIQEKDIDLELDIAKTKEKYKQEKKGFKRSFLNKMKHAAIIGTETLMMFGFTAHMAKKEYPDRLDPAQEKVKKEITWNEETRKEMDRITADYVKSIQLSHIDGEEVIPDSVLEKRFRMFIETYLSDVSVEHIDVSENEGGFINDIAEKVVGRENPFTIAHYMPGTIHYAPEVYEEYEAGIATKSRSNIDEFYAEISHHLNNDGSFRRATKVVEDFTQSIGNQSETYDNPYTAEYQAHTVTESAVRRWMHADKEELGVNFAELYNAFRDIYVIFAETPYLAEEDAFNLFEEIQWESAGIDVFVRKKEKLCEELKEAKELVDEIYVDEEKAAKFKDLAQKIIDENLSVDPVETAESE